MDNLDGTAQVPEVRILTQESEGFQTRTDVTGRRILQLLTHHPPAAKDKNSQQGTPVISEKTNEMWNVPRNSISANRKHLLGEDHSEPDI